MIGPKDIAALRELKSLVAAAFADDWEQIRKMTPREARIWMNQKLGIDVPNMGVQQYVAAMRPHLQKLADA